MLSSLVFPVRSFSGDVAPSAYGQRQLAPVIQRKHSVAHHRQQQQHHYDPATFHAPKEEEEEEEEKKDEEAEPAAAFDKEEEEGGGAAAVGRKNRANTSTATTNGDDSTLCSFKPMKKKHRAQQKQGEEGKEEEEEEEGAIESDGTSSLHTHNNTSSSCDKTAVRRIMSKLSVGSAAARLVAKGEVSLVLPPLLAAAWERAFYLFRGDGFLVDHSAPWRNAISPSLLKVRDTPRREHLISFCAAPDAIYPQLMSSPLSSQEGGAGFVPLLATIVERCGHSLEPSGHFVALALLWRMREAFLRCNKTGVAPPVWVCHRHRLLFVLSLLGQKLRSDYCVPTSLFIEFVTQPGLVQQVRQRPARSARSGDLQLLSVAGVTFFEVLVCAPLGFDVGVSPEYMRYVMQRVLGGPHELQYCSAFLNGRIG